MRHAAVPAAFLMFSVCEATAMDCDARRLNAAEKTICASNDLNWLDEKLQRLYDTQRRRVPDPNGLRSRQREWLKTRDTCRSDAACLRKVMKIRITELADCHGQTESSCKESDSLDTKPLARTARKVTFVDIGHDEDETCIPKIDGSEPMMQTLNKAIRKAFALTDECPREDGGYVTSSAVTLNSERILAVVAETLYLGGNGQGHSMESHAWDTTTGKAIELEREFAQLLKRLQTKPTRAERQAFSLDNHDGPGCPPAKDFVLVVTEAGLELRSDQYHRVCNESVLYPWKDLAPQLPPDSPLRTLIP